MLLLFMMHDYGLFVDDIRFISYTLLPSLCECLVHCYFLDQFVIFIYSIPLHWKRKVKTVSKLKS